MQDKSARRSNPERSADMRARLITTARNLFVAQGYAGTSTPAIVAGAGVTRGALYHHFSDKQAIFHAVIEADSATVAKAIEAADTPEMTAFARLVAGASAYVEAMQAEGRTRLLLIDGPAVLGRDAMQDIEARHDAATLRKGLEEAMAEGSLRQMPVAPLASLLSALFERAALDVASGMDPTVVLEVVRCVLLGLSTPDDRSADFAPRSQKE